MKRKLIPALLSGAMTLGLMYFGFSGQTTKTNLHKVGKAKAVEVKTAEIKASEQTAFTPVALALACPETPAAAGAAIIAGAAVYHHFFGSYEEMQDNTNQYALEDVKATKMSNLD